MPTMKEIIADSVKYAADVEIEVNSAFSTVSIGGPEGVFLDGHQADEFIAEARKLYEEVGDVTLDDCYAHVAKGYIDCLN
jgi:hypothetical protein